MNSPRFILLAVAAAFLLGGPPAFAADPELLTNPGFEGDLTGWDVSSEDAAQGMSKLTSDAARSGKAGLHVSQTGAVKSSGSSLGSKLLAVQPGETYETTFWVRCHEPSGVGVFLQFFDDQKHLLSLAPRQFFVAIPPTATDWTQFRVKGAAPAGAAWANVWIHGWSNGTVNADFDDFTFQQAVADKPEPEKATPAKVGAESASPRVSPERVKAVAAMLEANPRGVGQPISNRQAWERLAAEPGLRAAAVAAAERALGNPIAVLTDEQYLEFQTKGRAAAYQAEVDRRRYSLVVLVQAECLENQGRFLPAIEKFIAAACAERTWVSPPHDYKLANFYGTAIDVDLISAMTVWNLATADWLLGDRLEPATRRLIRAEAERRVFAPFLAEARGQAKQEWWSTSAYNWNAVVHSGIVGAATALVDAPATRAEIIAYAVQNVRTYLTGFKPDGHTGEGLGYWNYGFGHYTLMAETLLAATHGGVNLYADDRARLVAQLPRKLEILPNTYPAFADALITDRPDLWTLNILDHRYGFGWRIPPADRWISPAYSASLYALALNAFFDADSPVVFPGKPDPEPGYHVRDWLPDAQLFVGRPPTKGQAGLGLALKGGANNEPHGHLDLGTYVVASGDESLLVDPGAPVYTKETFGPHGGDNPLRNSRDHAVPLVARQLQKPGAEYRSTVLATSFTEALDSVTLDLTRAYAVPALKQLTRRFDYQRTQQGATTITDSATFQSPQAFGTALVTLGVFQQLQPDRFLVTQRHATLQVVVDTGGVPFTTKDEAIPGEMKSGHAKPRRLGIDLVNPAPSARITLRITPAAPVNPDPSLVSAAKLAALRPDYAKALLAKAADFVRQSGGSVVPALGMGATGGAVRSWKENGQALTWKFRVPEAGVYGVQVRHCGDQDEDTGCTLQIDGAAASTGDRPFFLPPTGGWSNESDDWRITWLALDGQPATLKLSPGEHEVTLTNRGGHAVLDWVRLVPCAVPTLG